MLTNGLVGIVGYALYSMNVTISGGVNSVDAIVPVSDCETLIVETRD